MFNTVHSCRCTLCVCVCVLQVDSTLISRWLIGITLTHFLLLFYLILLVTTEEKNLGPSEDMGGALTRRSHLKCSWMTVWNNIHCIQRPNTSNHIPPIVVFLINFLLRGFRRRSSISRRLGSQEWYMAGMPSDFAAFIRCSRATAANSWSYT